MRYRCLVLDHDDTAVQSTPTINYPSFVNTLSLLRPGLHYSYEEFVGLCADPGFEAILRDILGFTDEEMEIETQQWLSFVRKVAPPFWPGIPELVRRQKTEGGLVCVVSHSFDENIRRDYQLACPDAMPDGIYGWDMGDGRRKPDPWPLLDIMSRFELEPRDLLMVDDLRPGYEMATRCGVDFACAHWGLDVPRLRELMDSLDCIHLKTVDDLIALQFADA